MATVNTIVNSQEAPAALGPYSQAVAANGLVFCSGQIPIDPATGKFVDGGITEQTHQVLLNMSHVLKAANSSFGQVVKSTVFLSDMNNFAAMNAVYSQVLGEARPARSTIQVARLPLDALVEIEMIATTSA